MQRIYFDNAATTALDLSVFEVMTPYFTEYFGNPSSTHHYGRECRTAIEKSRKIIAGILNTKPGEIFFTSGGTESSNTAINAAVRDLQCNHIITTAIEHHATLHTVQFLSSLNLCKVSYVKLTQNGHIDLLDLENLLRSSSDKTLVSIMHANNEIGNINDIEYIGMLCKKYNALFHTDAVQTVGHLPIDLQKINIDFLSASAHKFHGPKGSGILYVNEKNSIKPLIHGGSQERNMRAGTENPANIIGFARALEIAVTHYEEDSVYIQSVKNYLKEQITEKIPIASFHGDTSDDKSLYTVLNVSFPKTEKCELLSINLDISGICISGGSACNSGVEGGSHVIKAVYTNEQKIPIRFSFCKHNTFEEVDKAVSKLIDFI